MALAAFSLIDLNYKARCAGPKLCGIECLLVCRSASGWTLQKILQIFTAHLFPQCSSIMLIWVNRCILATVMESTYLVYFRFILVYLYFTWELLKNEYLYSYLINFQWKKINTHYHFHLDLKNTNYKSQRSLLVLSRRWLCAIYQSNELPRWHKLCLIWKKNKKHDGSFDNLLVFANARLRLALIPVANIIS